MSDSNPKPLDYASPENREPPRFAVHLGGWVLLAMLVLTILAGVFS